MRIRVDAADCQEEVCFVGIGRAAIDARVDLVQAVNRREHEGLGSILLKDRDVREALFQSFAKLGEVELMDVKCIPSFFASRCRVIKAIRCGDEKNSIRAKNAPRAAKG